MKHRSIVLTALCLLALAAGCGTRTGGVPGVASSVTASTVIETTSVVGPTPPPVTETMTVEVTVTERTEHTVTTTVGTGVDTDSKVFDEKKVAAGVERILTNAPPNGYGLTGVTDLICPPDEPVEAGHTFECTMKIDGQTKAVTITVKDATGIYEVGVPH